MGGMLMRFGVPMRSATIRGIGHQAIVTVTTRLPASARRAAERASGFSDLIPKYQNAAAAVSRYRRALAHILPVVMCPN